MKSILDFIKVFKNIETYKGPGPRNMAYGGMIGKPGGIVEPGIEYYGNYVKKGYKPGKYADYGDRTPGFNQWLKDNKIDFKNISGEEKRLAVGKFERSQIPKNFITNNELARLLVEEGSSYEDVLNFADQFRYAKMKLGKDVVLNAKIKKAKKLVKLVDDQLGTERLSLKEVHQNYERLSERPTKVTLGTGKFPERYIKKDKNFDKKIKSIVKGLNEEFGKVGFRPNTIDNIFSLYNDKKFMDELRKYKGGEVNPKSHLFKTVFKNNEMAYSFMQLGRVLKGEVELEGINPSKNTGNKIIKSMAYDSLGKKYGPMWNASYNYAKFQLSPYLGKGVNYQTLSRSISQAFKEAGVTGKNIDEIFPLRTGRWGVGKGSDSYSNFVQFIDKEINQGKKVAFDRTATTRYNKIIAANKLGNYDKVTNLVKEHDAAIEDFYKKNPKAKGKVNLTQLRWDPKTNKFLTPKKVFESQYKGSYKTIPEKIRKGMEKFYTKTGLSLDPGTAMTLEAAEKKIKTLDKKGIQKFLKNRKFLIEQGKANAALKTAKKGGFGEQVKKICRLAKSSGGRIGFALGPDSCALIETDPKRFLNEIVQVDKGVVGKFFKTPQAVKIAKGIARSAISMVNPFSWIGGEVFYVGLEGMNSISKGVPWEEAFDDAFIFHDFKRVDKNIEDIASKMNLDESSMALLKNTMNINRIDSELGKAESFLKMEQIGLPEGNLIGRDPSDLTDQQNTVASYKRYISDKQEQLNDEIGVYMSNVGKLFNKDPSTLSEENLYKGFDILSNVFRKKVLTERQEAYKDIATRPKPLGGNIGQWDIFDLGSWTQPVKWAADVVNPFTKDVPYLSEHQKRKQYLEEIGSEFIPGTKIPNPKYNPRELYLYNRDARNLTPDSPLLDEALALRSESQPVLGTGTFNRATGGRVGYTDGGLTRTVAPDSGPMSQGLRSLYINDKDY
jgi:hypothetical protein